MKPVVFKRFKTTIHNPILTLEYDIADVDDLQNVIRQFGPKNLGIPYRVTVLRESCVVDMDKKFKNIPLFHQYKYVDGHPIIATETDAKFELILPKLVYANDVNEYLIKTYGRGGKFDPNRFDSKTPVFLDVFEHTSVGLRDSKTGAPTHMKWYDIDCKPLSKGDIVVDETLNQIWPIKTNEPPAGLIELLSQKTENTR